MKVAVAMSGGVDSSVAVALMKQRGHEVIGVTMKVLADASSTVDYAADAALKLGIPHRVFDFTDIFDSLIIDDFCREYSLGRTPNPCVRCNRYIKFGALLEKALEMGADYLATGHHARIEQDNDGRYLLKKGKDTHKDQSYFLCQLTREQLGRALFPVGDMTKEEVRRIAGEVGLPSAHRPESQEICFIPGDEHTEFLKNRAPQSVVPGPILDEKGEELGRHRGIISYTVGQRKGLGIAAGEPLYVTAIEPERNAVIVGTREQTYSRELVAANVNWIAIDKPNQPIQFKARVRYRHPGAEAVITPLDDDNIYVKFTGPQMAVTPGQTIAFYRGDTVIGGGTIARQGGPIKIVE
jgi:tRNA-specific 2-thiouridylase